jgi:hypothetical protein
VKEEALRKGITIAAKWGILIDELQRLWIHRRIFTFSVHRLE